jgi:hypothetical protein
MKCAIVASSIALGGIEFEDRGGGCRERDLWIAAARNARLAVQPNDRAASEAAKLEVIRAATSRT